MPPPVDDANLLNKQPVDATPRRIKLSAFKSKSVSRTTIKNEKFNLIDELDEPDENDTSDKDSTEKSNEQDDSFEELEAEFQFMLERVLNRQYASETDLSKMKWDESEESSANFNRQTRPDPIFAKTETNLFRTLSDSILTRRKTSKKINEYSNAKDEDEEEFIKIGTDYNDAIDEVFYQKQKIRDDYWTKNNLESASMVSNTLKSVLNESHNAKTPDIDEEIKTIESSSKQTGKTLNDSKTTDNTHEYFPKSKRIAIFLILFTSFFIRS